MLLACCQHTCRRPEIERLVDAVDATVVLELAEKHGIIPQLHLGLADYSDRIAVWPDLHSLSAKNARRALWLTQLLEKILGMLHSREIDALPYKGPALAQVLYGDISMRQYMDLDILVRTACLPAANDALQELGLSRHLQLNPAEEQAFVDSHYEYAFDGFGAPNIVELQWQILPQFYAIDLEVNPLFDRAVSVPLGGSHVRSLCNEDLFLVLCIHAAKHLWGRLSWILDIARLTESGSIDWDTIDKRVQSLGISRIVAVSCALTHSLFGTEYPRSTSFAVDEDVVRSILRRLPAGEQPDTESAGYFREIFRLRERRSDRIRFLYRLATTPSISEWSVVRLPPSLFPLYRFVRLFRLLGKIV